MRNSGRIISGVSLFSMSLALAWPAAADAQAAAPEAPTSAPATVPQSAQGGLEEITVTAEKRSERAEKTPISMSVLSDAALSNRSISTLADIAATTPSLTASKSDDNQFGVNWGIRGINGVMSPESPVGIYIDGVYEGAQSIYGTNGVGLTGLLDVQRIEVLKGPQGTLYGRNTAAGAVNVYSTLPTDQYEGSAQVEFGNYGLQSYTGILNTPLVEDKLDMRIVAQYSQGDGYQKNLAGGPDLGSYDELGTKGTLLFKPIDHLTLTLRGDFGHAYGAGNPFQTVDYNPNGFLTEEARLELGLPNTPAGTAAALAAINQYVNHSPNFNPVDTTVPNKSSFEADGASLTGDYDFSDTMSLRSITAFRHQEAHDLQDYQAMRFIGVQAEVFSVIDTVSQELTLSGTAIDGKLKYAIGGFYFHMDRQGDDINTLTPLFLPGSVPGKVLDDVTDDSYSGYGQATYTLVDGLNLTLGLRYTDEQKNLEATSSTGGVCAVPAVNLKGAACIGEFPSSFTNFSYTAGLDYSPTDDLMFYIRAATGFRAGGTNTGTAQPGSYSSYAPEKTATYEIGSKTQFLDNKLRLNLDYYHTDYNNLQRDVIVFEGNTQLSDISNAATAQIDGVEFDGAFEVLPRLILSGTAAYTDARYISYRDAFGDHTDQPFADTPRWTYSLQGAYTEPLGELGDLRGEIDWTWQSGVVLAPQVLEPAAAFTPPADVSQGSYGLLNARLALYVDKWDTEVALWGKNILNKQYWTFSTPQYTNVGYIYNGIGTPATFGVSITKKF